MPQFVYYLPLFTFSLSLVFAFTLFMHMKERGFKNYLLWWMLGMLTYGAGTLCESLNTLWGWSVTNFRFWYITGALLGGAPLAQGTVYLLLDRKTANILTTLLVAYIAIVSVMVFLSPINYPKVDPMKLSGEVMEWKWIRLFSPFINMYALIFLVGGAIYSAAKYYGKKDSAARFYGNTLIAVGGLLPGIGGTFTRFGHVEILYITELAGLLLIFFAYRIMRRDPDTSVHRTQETVEN